MLNLSKIKEIYPNLDTESKNAMFGGFIGSAGEEKTKIYELTDDNGHPIILKMVSKDIPEKKRRGC